MKICIICFVYPPQSRLKPSQAGSHRTKGMKVVVKKLESLSYSAVKTT